MRQRWYDAGLQRFIGRDPIMASNLFMYVGNRPSVLTDEYGSRPGTGTTGTSTTTTTGAPNTTGSTPGVPDNVKTGIAILTETYILYQAYKFFFPDNQVGSIEGPGPKPSLPKPPPWGQYKPAPKPVPQPNPNEAGPKDPCEVSYQSCLDWCDNNSHCGNYKDYGLAHCYDDCYAARAVCSGSVIPIKGYQYPPGWPILPLQWPPHPYPK